MTALDIRYDVSTQVLSSCPTDRLPAMCGSDTLAMLVSSTSMNVASVTVRATTHGLNPPVNPSSWVRRSDSAADHSVIAPHLGLHAHAGAQPLQVGLPGIDRDSHRDALHDL